MYERVEDEVDFCDDFSPQEEESVPEPALHDKLIQYLVEVLEWLFHRQLCAIHRNLAFYHIRERNVLSVAPDIAVVKGLPFQPVKSWRVGRTGPAPHVVFEILSEETWKKDVEEKPEVYARMGVQEYFAYDPNLSPLAEDTAERLFGWRLDPLSQHMVALPLPPDGSLWSQELESFLVPDEQFLRLYERNGQLRLTWAEAEAAARQAAEWQVRVLIEKLRSRGIDPDQL
jgi:Uma2 family endonuclease